MSDERRICIWYRYKPESLFDRCEHPMVLHMTKGTRNLAICHGCPCHEPQPGEDKATTRPMNSGLRIAPTCDGNGRYIIDDARSTIMQENARMHDRVAKLVRENKAFRERCARFGRRLAGEGGTR